MSLFFAVVTALGLAYVRLQHGAIPLDWMKRSIVTALEEDLGGARVAIGGAELRLDDGRFALYLTQTTVSEPDGRPLGQLAHARAVLSSSALRRGRIAVGVLDLVAPRFMLSTSPSGALTLSVDATATTPATTTPGAGAQPGGKRDPMPAQVPSATASAAGETAFDVVKVFTDLSARARRRETATGFLRQVGVKDAVVVVSSGAHRTVWNVPDARLTLDHGRESSSMAASATVATLTGPLTVTASTNDTPAADRLALDVAVTGFNPRGLARLVPGLGSIETIDLPLAGQAKLLLSTDGVLQGATVEAAAAQGVARFGLLGRKPVALEATRLAFTYDGARRAIDLTDFTFGWAGNKLSLAGQVVDTQAGGWTYALRSTGGTFAAPRAAQKGATIDQARAHGRFLTSAGRFTLEDFALKAARAEVTAKADVAWNNGVPEGQIDGQLSPMGIDVLVAIWPSLLAPNVRDWVASHVTKGQLAGGLFKAAIEGGRSTSSGSTSSDTNARLSLTLEASGVEVRVAQGMPPVEIPRGLLRAEGQTIEITAPEFVVTASEGRKLSFKTARFTAVETAAGDQPTAEVAFRLNGSLAAAADIADREPLKLLRANGISIPGLDGKIDGTIKAVFPLADNVQATEIRSEGKIRIADIKARQAVGPNDISGGTIDIDIGDKVVDVKGNLLVKGVNGRVGWQYQVNQPMAQQPPLRIAATLDNADRNTLGLDVADIVQGETPVEVLVAFNEGGQPQPRVRVDLTKAELTFEPIAWKKPAGRNAVFMFDPVKGPGTGAAQRLELQNMKVTGDDLALDGWMAIGPDNKPREFSLPEFHLNVVSRLVVHGKKRMPENVWEVSAKGPTFDGRDVFRALFNVGQPTVAQRKDKPGIDLTAEIETVIGFSDTTLKAVKLKMSQRSDKLTDLDLKSTLATGKPFAALLRQQPGIGRQLLAEAKDAGQVFKLVGFYPSAVGGEMQLEVNLDAKGVNEKSGTLWARDFAVLGDSIVGDLYQNAESQPSGGQGPNQPKRGAQQKVVRQQFDFDGLRIPFAVGSGQFVMNNAVIRGPIIGATFRGEIDFRVQRVNLGGTYVPLSGLNQALGSILGPLTGGPQSEGLFGITFQIVGPLANPQVIANPFALLAPGIFREIFQLTPETYRVTPRPDPAPAPAATSRTRNRASDPAKASSAPAATGTPEGTAAPAPAAPTRPKGEVLPGWSSSIKPAQ